MGDFLSGKLVYNQPGAVDEDRAYDRRLALEQSDGSQIFIYDPFDPISGTLVDGEQYEMIVSVQLPLATVYLPVGTPPPDGGPELKTHGWWQATIRNLEWWAGRDEGYHVARAGFASRVYVLLETPWGLAVGEQEMIRSFAEAAGLSDSQVGDTLRWEFTRNDLEAVV